MNTTSNQTYFCKYWMKRETELIRTTKIMSVIVVGGFALFGNIVIILLSAKYTLRKNINYMIINMAASDMLVVIMYSSLKIRENINMASYPSLDVTDDVAATILCKITKFLEMSAKLVTLINLLILSVERFRATRTVGVPRMNPRTRKKYFCLLATSWLIPMALSAYNLYFWRSLYVKVWNASLCFTIGNLLPWYTLVTAMFVLILITIAVLSILTLRSLSTSRAIVADLCDAHKKLRNRRMASATRMVLCSLLLYSCCYIPSFSLDVFIILHHYRITYLTRTCIDWKNLVFVTDFLLIVNSCFSPFVYIIFLKDFREAAKWLLFVGHIHRPQSTTTIVENTVHTTTKL